MQKYLLFALLFILNYTSTFAQNQKDLAKSVPCWLNYDVETNQASLQWLEDNQASQYVLNNISYEPTSISPIDTLDGSATNYDLGTLELGKNYDYHIKKGNTGVGVISMGLEIPARHNRGRCLLLIETSLQVPLESEINQLVEDISMDGWLIDTLYISQDLSVVDVKSKVLDWYDEAFEMSQTLFLLGHIPVPYSGNSAHDGHTNHQGAWPADMFYGDIDGVWSDIIVNNTSPSREENKNIPGDGKYDQSFYPSPVEIEIGRVDFSNLPAFSEDEIELTRAYLNKNHAFKMGIVDYPRRALIENNFASFDEGFGQSGWRNFTTMFGGDSVSVQNYETVLESEKYLCSYACGGGSYTSMSGVGNTSNLWVAKDIQTIFTMNFGSYFGDWDNQNNFLRSALASGDVLTNAWAGRPVWQIYHMALGKHIGFCAKETQNANSSIFGQGFSANNAHIALMGDPTLRLHAMQQASNVELEFLDGDIQISWQESPHATQGYFVYRRSEGMDWTLLAEFHNSNAYTDTCVIGNKTYDYMVKAIRLELTGSGTYFNTSLGAHNSIDVGENPMVNTYFLDQDMDGFGNPESTIQACTQPQNYVENDGDCDDNNELINPDADDLPNNTIDEDCDGEDSTVGLLAVAKKEIKMFPNPTQDAIFIELESDEEFMYRVFDSKGKIMMQGQLAGPIYLANLMNGLYWVELKSTESSNSFVEKIILQK